MNIVFRVDSSIKIGSGHLMRCLVLADELRDRGAVVVFICRNHAGNMNSLIEFNSHRLIELEQQQSSVSCGQTYADWLGCDQSADATQVIDAIAGEDVDWIIVDHYGLGKTWERKLRPLCSGLLVIDDIANRKHECDFLLDANYSSLGEKRYSNLIQSNTELLLGVNYSLMHRSFRRLRVGLQPSAGIVKRILVYFGASDSSNMTELCVKAITGLRSKDFLIDVVVGAMKSCVVELEAMCRMNNNISLHRTLPDLSLLISRSDLAFGATGVTTWERMCLGLPSIVITIADNQVPAATALHNDGLITYLGCDHEVTIQSVQEAITSKMADKGALKQESERIKRFVDGCGALRVVDKIYSNGLSVSVN